MSLRPVAEPPQLITSLDAEPREEDKLAKGSGAAAGADDHIDGTGSGDLDGGVPDQRPENSRCHDPGRRRESLGPDAATVSAPDRANASGPARPMAGTSAFAPTPEVESSEQRQQDAREERQ